MKIWFFDLRDLGPILRVFASFRSENSIILDNRGTFLEKNFNFEGIF